MDLSKLDTENAAETPQFLHLKHPASDEPLYVTSGPHEGEKIGIELMGRDSAAFQNVIRRYQNKRFGENKKVKTAEVEAMLREANAAVTVKFHHVVFGTGEDAWAPNAREADEVYRKHSWVLEQVTAFVDDRSNFFPNVLEA